MKVMFTLIEIDRTDKISNAIQTAHKVDHKVESTLL